MTGVLGMADRQGLLGRPSRWGEVRTAEAGVAPAAAQAVNKILIRYRNAHGFIHIIAEKYKLIVFLFIYLSIVY